MSHLWMNSDAEADHVAEHYVWFMMLGFAAIICAVLVVSGLARIQSTGEHPGFTCDPGGVYTVKECE